MFYSPTKKKIIESLIQGPSINHLDREGENMFAYIEFFVIDKMIKVDLKFTKNIAVTGLIRKSNWLLIQGAGKITMFVHKREARGIKNVVQKVRPRGFWMTPSFLKLILTSKYGSSYPLYFINIYLRTLSYIYVMTFWGRG